MGQPKFRTQLHAGARRNYAEIGFGGVDLTSPRFQAAESHAIEAENYVWRGSALHKRHGTETGFVFSQKTYYFTSVSENREDYIETDKPLIGTYYGTVASYEEKEDSPVYDIWFFGHFVIVHKGQSLFYARTYETSDNVLRPIAATTILKDRSNNNTYCTYLVYATHLPAVQGDKKFWLFAGNRYLCIEAVGTALKMTRVSESDMAYVPTTTIGITANESGIGGTRESFESVNLLTRWRKNTIGSGMATTGNESVSGARQYTYSLDGPIVTMPGKNDISDITVTIRRVKQSNEDDGSTNIGRNGK